MAWHWQGRRGLVELPRTPRKQTRRGGGHGIGRSVDDEGRASFDVLSMSAWPDIGAMMRCTMVDPSSSRSPPLVVGVCQPSMRG